MAKTNPAAFMAVGIGAGTAIGGGLMAATDNAAMLAVGIGAGVAIGGGLMAAATKKQASEEENDK